MANDANSRAVTGDIISLAVGFLNGPGVRSNRDGSALAVADIAFLAPAGVPPRIKLRITDHFAKLVAGHLRLALLLSLGQVKRATAVIAGTRLRQTGVAQAGDNRVVHGRTSRGVEEIVISERRIVCWLAEHETISGIVNGEIIREVNDETCIRRVTRLWDYAGRDAGLNERPNLRVGHIVRNVVDK